MLAEVDTALRSMLATALPPGTVVRFDAPEPSWRGGPDTVGALLYRVVEDLTGRAGTWSDARDEHGRVVARVPAARRYRITYLLTAWAADVVREHALLGSVLATLGASVAEEHLPGLTLAVASPEFAPAPLELWSALGVPPRASLELVCTAPVPVRPVVDLPGAPDAIELGVAGSPPPAPAPPRSVAPPRGRITERPA